MFNPSYDLLKYHCLQRRHPALGDVYCPHIVNYQWESFNLLSIKTWHCQCMFININTNSVFHGIAVWQGRLFPLERIKGRIAKRSANSQNCWNTKQNNKGHHNQDIILGQSNELKWQHPKQLWGWHDVCFISGELHFKRLQLLDEKSSTVVRVFGVFFVRLNYSYQKRLGEIKCGLLLFRK